MAVPSTVRTALADCSVAGRRCLEAGAGVGNTTAGLLESGAGSVYAVTNDPDHAAMVRERFEDERNATVLKADLRETPLSTDSVDFLTAHGLCNVVPPAHLSTIAAELTRVATPGAQLVVDDYAPPPDDAAIRDLFAVENAVTELARGRPALTFYPAVHLRAVFADHGWRLRRRETLLDPVPWTEAHVEAHLGVVREAAAETDDDAALALLGQAERLAADIGSEDAGEMYSLAFRLPE